ncbi:MAG TPA: BamA/TamA family outer membrane protein [Kofleriaceae bacterium]|jgi:hypothetical protein|nr:BamA/TamA family outer membrane protein [Kofleriaceae bacterium]
MAAAAAAPAAADPATDPVTAKPEVASAAVPRPAGPDARPTVAPGGPPASRELTWADLAGAPVPGAESGRIDPPAGDSIWRLGLRGLLFVPKVATDAVLSPVKLTAWAYDRYHLDELYYRVFFNDARTIGLVPTAALDSGFGISGGARFVDRNVLGAREHLSVEAQFGGRYRQVYKAALRSGDRLGHHLAIEIDGQYEMRPKDPFWGIGDNSDSAPPAAPIDPRTDPTAVDARYRERIARAAGVIDARLIDHIHLRSSTELTERTFAASSASDLGSGSVPIDAVYDPMTLVGFGGVRSLYSELELRFDDRGRTSYFEPVALYSVGSLAAVFAGRTHRLDSAPDYWRYGVDLQHFFRLTEGPRVLALRLRGEGVSGTLAEVPFTELPQLGGADDLRGYPADRFRDRVSAVGSAEYEWDLSDLLSASVYVDAGRVFRSLDDVGSGRLRVGYGIALQGHTEYSFGFRGSLSSSIDGGLFFNLSFNQVFALDERVRRR